MLNQSARLEVGKMSKWQEGRQGSGYFKLPLIISERFNFDSYILKYPAKSYIDTHKDVVAGFRHYRVNFTFWGDYTCAKLYAEPIFRFWRIYFFRPDLVLHEVTQLDSVRYVLSIGWLK